MCTQCGLKASHCTTMDPWLQVCERSEHKAVQPLPVMDWMQDQERHPTPTDAYTGPWGEGWCPVSTASGQLLNSAWDWGANRRQSQWEHLRQSVEVRREQRHKQRRGGRHAASHAIQWSCCNCRCNCTHISFSGIDGGLASEQVDRGVNPPLEVLGQYYR